MPLNPWRLRLLTQLQSLGTVRAVAEAATMSPSSVSQQLAVLEAETRTRLLDRVGRRVRLTPAGVLLAQRATELLDRMDTIEAELAGLTTAPTGPVRLAAFSSAMQTIVARAAGRVRHDHPGISLEVTELEPHLSMPALQRSEFDLVVTAEFVDGSLPLDPATVHVPLAVDDVVLVLPHDHPAATTPEPAVLADLHAEPWSHDTPDTYLSNLLLRSCRSAGFEPRITGRFASYGVLLGHVEAGLSVTLLPELAVDRRYRVTTRPLRTAPRRRITAAMRRGATTRVAVDLVLTALLEAASALVPAEPSDRSL